MILKSLRGREYRIDLRPSKWPRRNREECKSELQWGVGCILDEYFGPNELILEEFYIPGERLYVDFLIPRKSLAIEVHGQQHYSYSEYYHGSKENFLLSQNRDRNKEQWCKLNNIEILIVPYNYKKDWLIEELKRTNVR